MAMNLDALLRIKAQVDGQQAILAFNRNLKGLDDAAKLSAADLNRMGATFGRMAREAGNTTAGIKQHIAALQALRDRTEIGTKAYGQLGNQIDQLKGKLRSLDGQIEKVNSQSFNGLTSAAGRLLAAFSAIQAVRFVFTQAADLEKQTRSLQVLTGSAEQAGQIIKELQAIGAVTPFTSAELIDTAKRLQAFGVEANQVVDITRRLADVSGATGAELDGLATAYGQVQAKGRLQGEELLQFQERGVALQQVLREEYGLTGEEFQKALEKGQISAEAVEYALIKLTDAGGKYANGAIAQSDTLNGRLSTLQDAVGNLAARLGTILAPAMQGILGLAIDIANQINGIFETILLQRQLGANLAPAMRNQLFKQAGQEAEQIAKLRGGGKIDPAVYTQLREERFRDLMRSYGYQQGVLTPPKAAAPAAARTLPALTGGTSVAGAGRKGAGKSEADKAAEAAKKQAEELKRSYESGIQLGTQLQRRLLLLDAATDRERKLLQIGFDHEDRLKQINELMNAQQRINLKQLSDEQKRLELRELDLEYLREQLSIFERIAGIDFSKTAELGKRAFAGAGGAFDPSLPDLRVSPAEQQMAKYREELAALTNPINMAVTGADAIGSAFGQAFQDIATGAKSTQQALADTFKAIGESFIQMAAQIIAKQLAMIAFQGILRALGGGGGGFSFSGAGPATLPGGAGFAQGFSMPALMAEGGYVTGPTQAVVGEGGEPEYVIPASKMRSAMQRYAGGARGDAVIPGSGSEPTAAVGEAIATGAIDVRYTVERINSVDYVTADQFQRGMAQAANQGAKQGEQLAMRRLQQSASTRSRLGI